MTARPSPAKLRKHTKAPQVLCGGAGPLRKPFARAPREPSIYAAQ